MEFFFPLYDLFLLPQGGVLSHSNGFNSGTPWMMEVHSE